MSDTTRQNITRTIRELATASGFSYCGFSKAEKLDEEARHLEKWLLQGSHGKMQYMENHFEKRIDPTQLMPGAKSVISLAYNYYTEKKQDPGAGYIISQYAFGEDYHFVIKDKLKEIIFRLQEQFGTFEARIFVDSAPVLEKAWAKKSGLGWQGKNTNIIHPKSGSFFFLAEIICDLALEYDHPITDHCGTCTACLDACPTGALTPYTIDAKKCISYLTIELKDQFIPDAFNGKMEHRIFGCDICQDVCPWNRFSKQHAETRFEPKAQLLSMQKNEWEEITEEVFKQLFKNSAVQRTKPEGLKRNIRFSG